MFKMDFVKKKFPHPIIKKDRRLSIPKMGHLTYQLLKIYLFSIKTTNISVHKVIYQFIFPTKFP